MITRSWGPVQTSLLNDAATSLVCWSGKCFANHSRVREPDAQGCFYAMIYFEKNSQFLYWNTNFKIANHSRVRERDAQGRVLSDFLRSDPAIISANWHLSDKYKPYHEKLECNGSVFIFNPCRAHLFYWIMYSICQYYEQTRHSIATAVNNNGQEIKIWRSKVQLNSDKTSCQQGTAVLVLTLVFMSYWW